MFYNVGKGRNARQTFMMKRIISAVALVISIVSPSAAFAFHPGQGDSPPQGPATIACERGTGGISVAVAHGGRVHCNGIVPE